MNFGYEKDELIVILKHVQGNKSNPVFFITRSCHSMLPGQRFY